MKKTIGIFEAKTKLSELCSRVAEGGTEYVITRRGKPVARIVGPAAADTGASKGLLDRMAETENLHGPIPEDEPDFPDVWLERWGCKSSPFDDEEEVDDGMGVPGQPPPA